jgi:hypothetical protein
MQGRSLGGVIVVVGIIVVVIGLLVAGGALSWFGRLPGDIRIETDNTRVFIPITSMLLVSIALSVVLSLARRFFG